MTQVHISIIHIDYYNNMLLVNVQISQAATNGSTTSTLDINHLTTNLAIVSNRTDEGTSEYPTDLVNANELLEFSIRCGYYYTNTQ